MSDPSIATKASPAPFAYNQGIGFRYPKPTGKYDHPWIKTLPPGRARLYDIGYMAVTTVLASAAAYGMFETARGSYYILAASRKRANEASKAQE